jgi:two-component system OmpR family sensor kinase
VTTGPGLRSRLTPRRPLSLRARLLWAFLVPLVVVLAVAGFAATTALRAEQLTQVDTQLRAAVERSALADHGPGGRHIPNVYGGPDFLSARGQGNGTLGARLVRGALTEAAVIGDEGQTRSLTGHQQALIAATPADGQPRTVDLGRGLGIYRVAALPAPDGDVLVTGLPLGSAQEALLRLIAVEVVVGLVGLLAAAAVGFAIIRRTLRPLHRVAQTATRVSELQLSSGEVQMAERVPPADTDAYTEVGQVGSALNRLLDHVENSLTARQASETQVRQFVADASHELRTPIASIRGYAELMRRRDGGVPEEVGHAMRRVESEALRMSGLVDDLLLLARLDAGRDLAVDTVDLTALLVDAVSDAHAASPRRVWRVEQPGTAVTVPGDETRLHQVLANLFSNIRTHTPEGTTATARLRVADGWAQIEIEDDGPGIPPELLSHVFERFARGDSSRSRLAGSTGLGLAIVDAVVSAHGGQVAVTSRPGHTLFVVRLPGAVVTPDDEDAEDHVPAGELITDDRREGAASPSW